MLSFRCVNLAFAAFGSLLLLPDVTGMAHLTPEMVTARNLEEYLEAEAKIKTSHEGIQQHRLRKLQEEGLEDSKTILADAYDGKPGFYHGVASGDPLQDAVVIWARYTPLKVDEVVTLELRMAAVDSTLAPEDHLDPSKNPKLRRALIEVTSETDFIAKVDVTDLPSNTDFVFAFLADGNISQVGQTKTAPSNEDDIEQMVYAVFSCAHFSNGYFHPYDVASTIEDLDFWVHVGDYVYEYGAYSTYASDVEERDLATLPAWEQISLQDHRNRMATYHTDEGLRNLRRRAPMIATWDDHETTNNAFGDGQAEFTGAENHQPVCSANASSPVGEKNAAKCDRDEGDIVDRLNAATQAYLEWMPLRAGPGSMGVVGMASITQVIEWGSMATIVAFDTRITHRSMAPTLAGANWNAFFPFATAHTDVSQYMNQSSTSYEEMMTIAESIRERLEDPDVTMIGESKDTILKEAFAASKAAGKPWQIWAAATALGRAVKGDYRGMTNLVDEGAKEDVGAFVDNLFTSASGTFIRTLSAQAFTDTPWNNDDFGGFAIEQREILSILKENSNNAIILAGDLHDSYAWTLYEDGAVDGEPCAVNLVCPAVTSPGWGPSMYGIFNPLEEAVGGKDALYDTIEQLDEMANPGLKYFNMQFKGFYAVKATKESHVTEYFGIRPDILTSNYVAARALNNDGITAAHICDSHLTTTAGMPGSLDRDDSACGTIKFASARPALWELPVPESDDLEGVATLSDCGMLECKFDAPTMVTTKDVTDAPTEAPTAGAGGLLSIMTPLVMSLGMYFVL